MFLHLSIQIRGICVCACVLCSSICHLCCWLKAIDKYAIQHQERLITNNMWQPQKIWFSILFKRQKTWKSEWISAGCMKITVHTGNSSFLAGGFVSLTMFAVYCGGPVKVPPLSSVYLSLLSSKWHLRMSSYPCPTVPADILLVCN